MAKFSLPQPQDETTRSSIRVPKQMLSKIEILLESSAYNRKQRSKWIEDITEKFLNRTDAANLIAEEFIVPGSTASIPVTISQELNQQISNMIDQVKNDEGVKTDRSSIIRTAITQTLMANSGLQLSPWETLKQKIITEDSHD